jgi:TatD DNase family protein
MFDAHFHLPLATNTKAGICCTSKAEEWEKLASLPPSIIPSIGLLPPLEGKEALFFQALREHPTFAIGEVGFDGRFPDGEGQEAFLRKVMETAASEKRLVTLHCVHRDGLLLSFLNPSVLAIWHGFTGSVETAKEAEKKGCVLSFGYRVEHSRLWNDLKRLREVPFLLETDGQSAEDEKGFAPFAERLARHMGYSLAELEAHLDGTRAILADRTASRQ